MSELPGRHLPENVSSNPGDFIAALENWDTKINDPALDVVDLAIVSAFAMNELNKVQDTVGQSVIFWGMGLYLAPGTGLIDRRYSSGDGGGRPAVGVSHGVAVVPVTLESTKLPAFKFMHEIRFPGQDVNGKPQVGKAYFDYIKPHFMPSQLVESSFLTEAHPDVPMSEQLYRSTVQRRVDIMAKRAYYLDIDDSGRLAEFTPVDTARRTLGAHCLSMINLEDMWDAWPWPKESLVVPEDATAGNCLCLDPDRPTRNMLGLSSRQTLYVPTSANIVNYEVRDNIVATGGQS
jgi:hypothetical protein